MERFRQGAAGRAQARKGAGEGERKACETQTRQSGERERGERGEARQREGAEELAKLSLTAMGPPDNPGILSEINLSSWSC